MGCLIKMIKLKGGIRNISFIKLEKALKREKKDKSANKKNKKNVNQKK